MFTSINAVLKQLNAEGWNDSKPPVTPVLHKSAF